MIVEYVTSPRSWEERRENLKSTSIKRSGREPVEKDVRTLALKVSKLLRAGRMNDTG